MPTQKIRPAVRFVASSLALALALLVARVPLVAQEPAARLRHLQGIEELKRWFNAGNGHPRLIFLLSPT